MVLVNFISQKAQEFIMIRLALSLAALALLSSTTLVQAQDNCPSMQYNASASVWDSALAGDGSTLFPIGGSGQVNGAFTLCNHPGAQIGLRVSERFVGPITPERSDFAESYTGTYMAPAGDSGGDALWNVEFHLDMGYAYQDGGAAPESLADASVMVSYDCDPLVGVVNGPSYTIPEGEIPPTTLVLLQGSENPSFAFVCGSSFDPNADGSYEISAAILDPNSGTVLAQTDIVVQVGDNPPLPPAEPAAPVPSLSLVGLATLISMLTLLGMFMARRHA